MKKTTENSAGPLSTNPNSQIDNETIPVPPSHESASCSAKLKHFGSRRISVSAPKPAAKIVASAARTSIGSMVLFHSDRHNFPLGARLKTFTAPMQKNAVSRTIQNEMCATARALCISEKFNHSSQ